MARLILLVQLVTLCTIQGTQAVRIIWHPQDQKVSVGGVARFQCGYNESRSFPNWLINNTVYTIQALPGHRYSFHDQTLTLRDVQYSDNLTTYQCIVSAVRSERATLFVILLTDDDVTEKITTLIMSTTPATAPLSNTNAVSGMAAATVTATTASNLTEEMMASSHDENVAMNNDFNTIVLVSVCGSAVMFFIITFIAIVAIIKCHKKEKVHEPVGTETITYEEIKDVRETAFRNSPATENTREELYEEVKTTTQTPPSPNITPQCPIVENPSYCASHIIITPNISYISFESQVITALVKPTEEVGLEQEPLYATIEAEQQQLHSGIVNEEERCSNQHCLADKINTSSCN